MLSLIDKKIFGLYLLEYNTSPNKFVGEEIDGATIAESIWFLKSTNLQMIPVKISWESDV